MASVTQAPAELEAQIGYQFRNPTLLVEALTHRSYTEADPGSPLDNERLEFLGDAVLGLLVSDALCSLFPQLTEGQLSRIRARLVSGPSLRRVAERLALGRFLRLGPAEEKGGGRQKQTLLADAIEALVAAIYRDGGLPPARRFVERFLLHEVEEASLERLARADYKSALQELLHARRLPTARYRTVETRGPEHEKTFTVELWVGEHSLARGEGPSKKAAEQQAARRALQQLPREENQAG